MHARMHVGTLYRWCAETAYWPVKYDCHVLVLQAKEDQLKEEAMAIDFLEHLAELEEQAVETREKGVTKIEKTRRATKNNSISGGTAPRRAQLKKQQETES
eukprot:jgi/Botrbrau1/21974/Bobra.0514s0001.1